MKSNELLNEKFKREIAFRPAFDRRHPDPNKNYGIHGMEIRFLLKGPKGTIQFLLYTGMHLSHVMDELWNKTGSYNPFKYMGADIGYHSPKRMFEGQTQMREDCDAIGGGGPCFYDGSSLNAEPIANLFIEKGEDAVWKHLEEDYNYRFEERGYYDESKSGT